MLYNKHEIKLNKHMVDLGEKVHVFYHANAEDRKSAIQTIIDSANLSIIFVTDKNSNIKSDNEKVFIVNINELDKTADEIEKSIEHLYSFLFSVNTKPKTIDQLMNEIPEYKNRYRYTLLVINDANTYLKSEYYHSIMIALQKGRAVGYHVILMDEKFPNDFRLLANIPAKIIEKEGD